MKGEKVYAVFHIKTQIIARKSILGLIGGESFAITNRKTY